MLDFKKKLNHLKTIPNRSSLKRIKHSQIQKTCPGERYRSDYGVWVICPIGLIKTSNIYLVGIDEDIPWDKELIARYGGETYQ